MYREYLKRLRSFKFIYYVTLQQKSALGSLVYTQWYFEKYWFKILIYKNPTSALYCACVLSSKILCYLLAFIIAISDSWISWFFCCLFLPSVLIIEGVVGVDGGAGQDRVGWDRMGWEVEKPPFGTPHEQTWQPRSGQWHTSGSENQLG